jgi:PAS domain S-box-containing protein
VEGSVIRILISEDDYTSRTLLAAILKKDGHEVVETVTGMEALAELRKPNPPWLAILDWVMPEMDGLEVVRCVRAQETDYPPYILLLTARSEKADIVTGLEAGADDYLTKPFHHGELRARIAVGRRLIEMRKTLKAEKCRLEDIVWGTNVGTWEWNIKTGETQFSERWAAVIGYAVDDLDPISINTWTNLAHPEDLIRSRTLLERNFSGELDEYDCEIRMRHKKGNWVWVHDRGKVVEWTEGGEPVRMSGTRADITQRKRAEETLQRKRMELENLVIEQDASRQDLERQAAYLVELAENEAVLINKLKYESDVKNRFFSIISHDLRTPFTSLLGMTRLMAEMTDRLSKNQLADYAKSVNDAGERVFGLLQNLLEWSRLQIESTKFEPEMTPLREAVHECIEIYKPAAMEKGIQLTNNTDDTFVFVDPDMVRAVIRNLIGNALKFTATGGTIELASIQYAGEVEVIVTDSGVGMSKERFERIFALDQKTSTIGTAGEKGTGLGLPLCKDMLERNRGRIWVESSPGAGSKFHFALPVAPA